MIETAQLIHVCDHLVESISTSFVPDTIIRSISNDYDIICPGFIIGDIYCLFTTDSNGKNTFYYEGVHYQKFTADKIQWISSTRPSDNSTYTLEYIRIQRTIIKYEQLQCTRCNGNGWYVDLVNKSGTLMSKINGTDRVMQDFIKIILTKSNDDATDIFSFAANTDYKNTPEQISQFIKRCEDKYMQKQLSMISDGKQLDASEMLNRVLVQEIDYDQGLSAYFILITLVMSDGETVEVGLKI